MGSQYWIAAGIAVFVIGIFVLIEWNARRCERIANEQEESRRLAAEAIKQHDDQRKLFRERMKGAGAVAKLARHRSDPEDES